MIFIKKQQNSICIPKHNINNGPFKLVLTNCLSHNKLEFDNLTDYNLNTIYYVFNGYDFSQLESGESEYTLYDVNGDLCENGLVQFVTEPTDSESISYKKELNKIVYNG